MQSHMLSRHQLEHNLQQLPASTLLRHSFAGLNNFCVTLFVLEAQTEVINCDSCLLLTLSKMADCGCSSGTRGICFFVLSVSILFEPRLGSGLRQHLVSYTVHLRVGSVLQLILVVDVLAVHLEIVVFILLKIVI